MQSEPLTDYMLVCNIFSTVSAMLLDKIQADDTGEALEGFSGIQLIYLNGYVIFWKHWMEFLGI